MHTSIHLPSVFILDREGRSYANWNPLVPTSGHSPSSQDSGYLVFKGETIFPPTSSTQSRDKSLVSRSLFKIQSCNEMRHTSPILWAGPISEWHYQGWDRMFLAAHPTSHIQTVLLICSSQTVYLHKYLCLITWDVTTSSLQTAKAPSKRSLSSLLLPCTHWLSSKRASLPKEGIINENHIWHLISRETSLNEEPLINAQNSGTIKLV